MSPNLWIKMANLVFELEKKLGGAGAPGAAGGAQTGKASTAGSAASVGSGGAASAGSDGPARVGAAGASAAVSPAVLRNLERMKSVLDEAGLLLLNPFGEAYTETRTDLEASITGNTSGALIVVDVIKPIIYSNQGGSRELVQKGVVIVGNK